MSDQAATLRKLAKQLLDVAASLESSCDSTAACTLPRKPSGQGASVLSPSSPAFSSTASKLSTFGGGGGGGSGSVGGSTVGISAGSGGSTLKPPLIPSEAAFGSGSRMSIASAGGIRSVSRVTGNGALPTSTVNWADTLLDTTGNGAEGMSHLSGLSSLSKLH